MPTTAATLYVVAAFPESADILYAGELEIRLDEGLVLATGRALTLSVREFELLAAMARRAGAIITREELYDAVWGGELRAGDRSVDVYVSKLRGKLEAALPDRRFIHTHPGFRLPLPAAARRGRGRGGTPFTRRPRHRCVGTFTKCSHRTHPTVEETSLATPDRRRLCRARSLP